MIDAGHPLPSKTTLQRRLENIAFSPGILKDLLPSLHSKVKMLNEEEREDVLLLDEISITPVLDYDSSSEMIIGRPTVPSANGSFENLATHALVFMIAGMSTRWKQIVAYHLTDNSFCPKIIKKFLFDLIYSCENLALKINVIISDMSGNNQALLQQCGIIVGRHSVTTNSCDHPCASTRKLFFMLDALHILKNIRNHLVEGLKFK